LDKKALLLAMKFYTQRYDTEYGGFGKAPKFPTPVNLTFLLELARLRPDDLNEDAIFAAKQMVLNTLHKMALGGIHGTSNVSNRNLIPDSVGHGFARYSVTQDWSLPHFEKMYGWKM